MENKFYIIEKSVGYVGNEPITPIHLIGQRVPGQLVSQYVEGMRLVHEMQRPPKDIDPNIYDTPVMKVSDIVKNLGLTSSEEVELASFIKTAINESKTNGVLLQTLYSKLNELGYDSALKNVILQKTKTYINNGIIKSFHIEDQKQSFIITR